MASNILHFQNINSYLETVNCGQQTKIDGFCILKFSELGSHTRWEMPPCQKDFYQINLIIETTDTSYWFNTNLRKINQKTLFFISPAHVYAWKRDENLKGYLLYFDKAFLSLFREEIQIEYLKIFDVTLNNILKIKEKEFAKVLFLFELLHEYYQENQMYATTILRSSLLNLLNIVAAWKLNEEKLTISTSPANRHYQAYLNLVNSLFLKEKSVLFYARQLYISPNHLNAICKANTGKTAKMIISERILEEAKYLITFSDKTFSEVAFYLGFKEVAHFSRFFKKQAGISPQDYRKGNR